MTQHTILHDIEKFEDDLFVKKIGSTKQADDSRIFLHIKKSHKWIFLIENSYYSILYITAKNVIDKNNNFGIINNQNFFFFIPIC